MTVQWSVHSCPKSKEALAVIETTKVDGKATGWQWRMRHFSRVSAVEVREYIMYCPYCRKRLDE